MRFLITLVSIVSLLFVTPFAFAVSTQTVAPKPTAETTVTPGDKVLENGMMNDDFARMIGNDQNIKPIRDTRPLPGHGMYAAPRIADAFNPWAIFFCAITMILGWGLLISIICALWVWIKKQR